MLLTAGLGDCDRKHFGREPVAQVFLETWLEAPTSHDHHNSGGFRYLTVLSIPVFGCRQCGVQGSGMTERQKACCDSLVYISQHGGGTASLNVTVASSIVLHRFWGWKKDRLASHRETSQEALPEVPARKHELLG